MRMLLVVEVEVGPGDEEDALMYAQGMAAEAGRYVEQWGQVVRTTASQRRPAATRIGA